MVRGKIDLFSIDTLIDMISRAGGAVQVMALGDSGQGVTFGLEDQLTSGRSDRDFNDLLVTIGHFV